MSFNKFFVGRRPQSVGATPFNINSYSNCNLAFSLRLINSAYAGNPLIKLRRSSDNAVLDFGSGLALGSFLDYAAIDTWAAGANLFCDTLYDQSGNASHATNSTFTQQPQLIPSVIGLAARSLRFDGALSQRLFGGNLIGFMQSNNKLACYAVLRPFGLAFSTWFAITATPNTTGGSVYMRMNRFADGVRHSWRTVQWQNATGYSNCNLSILLELHYYYFTGTLIGMDIDNGGTMSSSTANSTLPLAVGDSFNLGADGASQPASLDFHEFILWDAEHSAGVSTLIKTSLNTTYGAY